MRAPRAAGFALAAAGLLAALAYFVADGRDLPALRLAAKPLPALLLASWVALRRPDREGRLVGSGLVLSATGDLVLELDRFLPGLAAFLLAHLCYIAAFVSSDSRPALPRLLPFAAFGVGVLTVLRTALGPMAIPVALYVAVICAMMWRAAARIGGSTPLRAAWVGLAGAIAFAASDTIIAFDRFSAPMPGARWTIMVLYWLGQWAIAASVATALRPGNGMLAGR